MIEPAVEVVLFLVTVVMCLHCTIHCYSAVHVVPVVLQSATTCDVAILRLLHAVWLFACLASLYCFPCMSTRAVAPAACGYLSLGWLLDVKKHLQNVEDMCTLPMFICITWTNLLAGALTLSCHQQCTASPTVQKLLPRLHHLLS